MSAEVLRDDCTPVEAVEFIRRTPASSTQIRPATVNLADLLTVAPTDPTFDLESWQRQWSEVEALLQSLTHANDVAEGRGRTNC
jgi:hypothetical protein